MQERGGEDFELLMFFFSNIVGYFWMGFLFFNYCFYG